MKTITKYQSLDGSEHTDPNKAAARDALCLKVDDAMLPLGDVPQGVRNGKGWLQHDLETVNQAKDAILEICRSEGYADRFQAFKHPGRDCHPLSIIGRILDENGGPLDKAWGRFGRIDAQGREHQQCFYAYTNGPLPEHVCVESRVGGGGGFSSANPSPAVEEHNDPKLSDRRSGRGTCRWAERRRWSAAGAVTAEPVRCSAWLGVAGVGNKRGTKESIKW